MSKDPIASYFENAVRAQSLIHTGEHFCTDHSKPCKDQAPRCRECPLNTTQSKQGDQDAI